MSFNPRRPTTASLDQINEHEMILRARNLAGVTSQDAFEGYDFQRLMSHLEAHIKECKSHLVEMERDLKERRKVGEGYAAAEESRVF